MDEITQTSQTAQQVITDDEWIKLLIIIYQKQFQWKRVYKIRA